MALRLSEGLGRRFATDNRPPHMNFAFVATWREDGHRFGAPSSKPGLPIEAQCGLVAVSDSQRDEIDSRTPGGMADGSL